MSGEVYVIARRITLLQGLQSISLQTLWVLAHPELSVKTVALHLADQRPQT